MWKRALEEEESDLSDVEELEEEVRSEAKQDIAPSVIAIHDVCLSVSQSLDPVRVALDGLCLCIMDE
jgi:hypothetical protein